MTNSFDNQVALTVLRRYDSQCVEIIDSCNKVKVYNFDYIQNTWVIQDDSDGVFYLIKRVLSPLYKFVILGKCNKPGSVPSAIDIPITQYYVSECRNHFYMFKNEAGIIQAIMFSNKNDCERVFKKVDRIIKELRVASEKETQNVRGLMRPNTLRGTPVTDRKSESLIDNMSSDDKILTLLESARQRYQEGKGDQTPMSTSAPDHRSRQIDINELFMTGNGLVNPVTQPLPSPSKNDIVSSYPDRTRATRKISLDIHDNGPSTMTVTELEKYFVEGASVVDNNKILYDESDDDDDGCLLGPQMLVSAGGGGGPSTSAQQPTDQTPGQGLVALLSKEQLRDALVHMLQTAADGNGGDYLLTSVHAAYVDLCRRRAANGPRK